MVQHQVLTCVKLKVQNIPWVRQQVAVDDINITQLVFPGLTAKHKTLLAEVCKLLGVGLKAVKQ